MLAHGKVFIGPWEKQKNIYSKLLTNVDLLNLNNYILVYYDLPYFFIWKDGVDRWQVFLISSINLKNKKLVIFEYPQNLFEVLRIHKISKF